MRPSDGVSRQPADRGVRHAGIQAVRKCCSSASGGSCSPASNQGLALEGGNARKRLSVKEQNRSSTRGNRWLRWGAKTRLATRFDTARAFARLLHRTTSASQAPISTGFIFPSPHGGCTRPNLRERASFIGLRFGCSGRMVKLPIRSCPGTGKEPVVSIGLQSSGEIFHF